MDYGSNATPGLMFLLPRDVDAHHELHMCCISFALMHVTCDSTRDLSTDAQLKLPKAGLPAALDSLCSILHLQSRLHTRIFAQGTIPAGVTRTSAFALFRVVLFLVNGPSSIFPVLESTSRD